MRKEFIGRVRNLFKPADAWDKAFHEGYHKGLREGQDFGERVAHNRTLAVELPRILSRYAQLQVRIINKPKNVIQKELARFEADEVERLKMDLQKR